MRRICLLMICLLWPCQARALTVPPDTSRWDLGGEAKPDEYQGRPCLMLNGGIALHSEREQVKKLLLGYSDDASVFLNGKILYRGRSSQYFRDPRFLGIVNPENDALYLPLKKGDNELMLAVSELGGGWGFIARLAP